MHADTRQRLLDIAEQLFAERGFYGVSIAAIASEVVISKAYFTTSAAKRSSMARSCNAYQMIFKTTSEQLQASEDPAERLEKFYAALAEPTETNVQRTRLLMRELLDNNERVQKQRTGICALF